MLPFVTYMSGPVYLIGALALDAGFLYYAIAMLRNDDDQIAWATFRYSIVYLTGLFFFFFLDHYWQAIMGFVTGA